MRIGICGYATAGKDEVAKIFKDLGCVSIGMSDALNYYLQILNPYVVSDEEGVERYADIVARVGYTGAKAQYPEVRRLLQTLGTEVGRRIDPDMWVKELVKRADRHEHTVTTGIRYPNEADAMDVLIHVERPGVGPLNGHSSEDIGPVIERAHYSIVNNGTLEELWCDAERLFNIIMQDKYLEMGG